MATFSIKFYCFFTLYWQVWRSLAWYPDSYYWDDKMGWHEKRKLINLGTDLFKESLLNMRQLIEVRNEHDALISFNVGMIMGRIREKYRFMIETYRDMLDQYDNRFFLKPPGLREVRAMHVVIALEMMHYYELEIDKLVDVLIDAGTGDLNSERVLIGQTEPRPWWEDEKNVTKVPNKTEIYRGDKDNPNGPQGPQGPHGPHGPHGPKLLRRAKIDILREQMEKSRMREQFLMKKLGMSANMTTMKKRFRRHWPVEDTWSLDKYNHDYK